MMHRFMLAALLLLAPVSAAAEGAHVPSWVKNTARWWSEGEVGDADFVKGMQYLIEQHMMTVNYGSNGTAKASKIPSWVKAVAGWWADGKVPDGEFVKGMEYLVDSGIIEVGQSGPFVLSSTAFAGNGTIPSQYTCDGQNVPPPLEISGVPPAAKSLALTVVDIDAPAGPYTHWVAWNIPPNSTSIVQGSTMSFPQGASSAGTAGYHGPCPPFGTHRYYFTLYALDDVLGLDPGASRVELENSIAGHVIGKAVMMGTYSRN